MTAAAGRAGPLVGITAHVAMVGAGDGNGDAAYLHHVAAVPYVRAVVRGGGVPVIVPTAELDVLDALLPRLDGLVVTGGCDVDPAAYGAPPDERLGATDPDRDAADFAIVRAAVERDLPTLAICRGVQVLNVALGGTLTQHVDGHMQLASYNDTPHGVTIEPSSRLAAIVGTTDLAVNTLHHQVIDRLAPRLVAVAHNPDGHVEAVEVDGAPQVLGVQWHPEMLRHRPDHVALFAWLAGA